MTTEASDVRLYGNWRKPKTAGLLGLGKGGTMLLLGGTVFVIFVFAVRGFFAAFGAALILGITLLLLKMRDADDQTKMSRIAEKLVFWKSKSQGGNVYRSGPASRHPKGTFQLPGIAAQIDMKEYRDSYGRPFALLHVPSTEHTTVVLVSEPRGVTLEDLPEVNQWVANWGQWLANLADEEGIAQASVTIETAPDSGARLQTEIEQNLDPNAPAFAKRMFGEIQQSYPSGSSIARAYIAVTFAALPYPGGEKRSEAQVARDIATLLPTLTKTLQETGAGAAHPATGQQLSELVRVAYDPVVAPLIDQAHMRGEMPDIPWEDVGPSAHQAGWASYRHDSGHSISWSMTRAPRGAVRHNVLSRILAPDRKIARKRVTILYRPIPPGEAATVVEKDVEDAEFVASSGRRRSSRATLSAKQARKAEDEESLGAGLTNFGMIVTATVLDRKSEAAAAALVRSMGAAARIRLRRQYGSQDSSFAAGLPLGLVMRDHIKIPAALKDKF